MPKHNKKKHKRNRKNKKQHQSPNHQRKKHNSKNKAKSKDHHHDNIKIQIHKPETSENPSTPSVDNNPCHSPIKLHYYDADVSDSDTNHPHNSFSPLIRPTPSYQQHSSPIPQKGGIQILRSAKISHRDSSSHSDHHTDSIFGSFPNLPIPKLSASQSNPYISPGFDRTNSPLISSHHFKYPHPVSPLIPSLHRATSSPISSTSHSPATGGILRSTSSPSTNTNGAGNTSSNDGHVSFGEVEVHEFKLLAGSESDGVPEDGGLSLHLDRQEIHNQIVDIEEYERKKYQRWKERAKYMHWKKEKLTKAMQDPEKYLFTAGNYEFYSALTPKERERRLSIDKEWKKSHSKEITAERVELDKLRKSRKKNDIFCNCKPLSAMSTSELKDVAKQYDIKVHEGRKVKKGFLINQLKSKVLNYRDICCWDKLSCSCIAAGIDCHSGTEQRYFQCGCIRHHRKCANQNGRYIYKQPRYSSALIDEWKQYYQGNEKENENHRKHDNENENDARCVSFDLN